MTCVSLGRACAVLPPVSLINFMVCDGGCSPRGVLQHLLLLQIAELFCCMRGLTHMGDRRFSPIPEQTKLEKIGYRNMEKSVGNQSWGQWPMQLATFHCTKKIHEESIQECKTIHICSFGTIGKLFVQQRNEKIVTLTSPAPPVPSQQWVVWD